MRQHSHLAVSIQLSDHTCRLYGRRNAALRYDSSVLMDCQWLDDYQCQQLPRDGLP